MFGGRGIHIGFLQHGTPNEKDPTQRKDDTTINVLCYNYNKRDHISFNLNEPDRCQNGGKYGN